MLREAAREGELTGEAEAGWDVPRGLLNVLMGLVLVYSMLFATGFWLYSNTVPAVITTATGLLAAVFLTLTWKNHRARGGA